MKTLRLSRSLRHLTSRVASAQHVLFCLDFDGTLAPTTESPQDAAISNSAAAALDVLLPQASCTVAILSGRALSDVEARVDSRAICSGNHGLEIEGDGISFVHEGARKLRPIINQISWDLMAALTGIPGVLVENKGLTSTVHFRQAPAELEIWLQSTIGLVLKPYAGLARVRQALKAWEIRPCLNWHKGAAVRYIMQHLAHSGRAEPLVICAGNDGTDEDMFRLPQCDISIVVGPGESDTAQYRATNPAELARFLQAAGRLLSVRQPVESVVFHDDPQIHARG